MDELEKADTQAGPKTKKARVGVLLTAIEPEIITEQILASKFNQKDLVSTSLFQQDHSACYDAFMTGFVFGHQICVEVDSLKEAKNKLYLIGKQIPLLVQKSKYSKVSKQHALKVGLY